VARADEALAALAGEQVGLFNLAQARAAGITPQELRTRLQRGGIVRVLPSVFCIAGCPRTWEMDAMAACLWAGEGSAASHGAAARLWGLPGFAHAPVEISALNGRRPKRLGFVVHRVDHYVVPEIVTVGAVPATSPRRTLLDVAGRRHPQTEPALDHCLRTDLTSLGRMWLLYDEEWTRGRRGIAILRDLLVERTGAEAPSQSGLEDMMWRLVRRSCLPVPRPQHHVAIGNEVIHVDFAYPEAHVAIELDGYAWHMDRASFERDRERDNALTALGWRVLRFTWAKLRWQPDYVADMIQAHLGPASGS
jgi:very-short-patch-repair endonuclease